MTYHISDIFFHTCWWISVFVSLCVCSFLCRAVSIDDMKRVAVFSLSTEADIQLIAADRRSSFFLVRELFCLNLPSKLFVSTVNMPFTSVCWISPPPAQSVPRPSCSVHHGVPEAQSSLHQHAWSLLSRQVTNTDILWIVNSFNPNIFDCYIIWHHTFEDFSYFLFYFFCAQLFH